MKNCKSSIHQWSLGIKNYENKKHTQQVTVTYLVFTGLILQISQENMNIFWS